MDVVVWRGETERELVVLSGDRRYVMLVDDDVEMMRSGFRYFVDQNGVRSVCVVGFGIGDDVYDMMVIVMCLGMGLRLCVDSSGESIWRLVYWGESDFYRRVLLEYGSRCVSRCTLRRVIGDVRVRERFGVLDGESGLYMFECPQCMCVFTIHESELACKIARHGVGELFTIEQSKEMGQKLSDRVWGRYALEDVKSGNKVLVKKGEIIDSKIARAIDQAKVEMVHVRSVLQCRSRVQFLSYAVSKEPRTSWILVQTKEVNRMRRGSWPPDQMARGMKR
jgi:hypothetical protein